MKNNRLQLIFAGAALGFFYYLLKLVMRPEPYVGFTHELGRLLSSVVVGILIFALIALIQSKSTKPPS